jgi:hypothetical protein
VRAFRFLASSSSPLCFLDVIHIRARDLQHGRRVMHVLLFATAGRRRGAKRSRGRSSSKHKRLLKQIDIALIQ